MNCKEALFVLLLKKRTRERDPKEVREAFRHVDDCEACRWTAGLIKDRGADAVTSTVNVLLRQHEIQPGERVTDETTAIIADWFWFQYRHYLLSS